MTLKEYEEYAEQWRLPGYKLSEASTKGVLAYMGYCSVVAAGVIAASIDNLTEKISSIERSKRRSERWKELEQIKIRKELVKRRKVKEQKQVRERKAQVKRRKVAK